ILAHASARTKGALEVPAQAIKGEYELLTAHPNKSAMQITLPGVGTIMQGFDGTVAWSNDPMQGAHVMTGKELDAVKERGGIGAELRSAELLTSAETVEKTQMGGQTCYKVKIVWKSGRTSYDCYSTESGLRVGMNDTQDGPMGAMEIS